MDKFSTLYGTNSPYLEALYQDYQKNPASVPANWRDFFDGVDAAAPAARVTNDGLAAAPAAELQSRVSQMIQAYRNYGHKSAHTNPLADAPDLSDDLKPIAFGLTMADMAKTFATEGVLPQAQAPLADILAALRATYCGSVGVQYFDTTNRAERLWLQERLERRLARPALTVDEKKRALKGLMVAERFEQFIHKKFVGAKRFSVEGGESLIPMLDVLIDAAGAAGVTDMVMGMAHRGRLNVLVNILNKPYSAVFSEFAGTMTYEDDFSSGDVKYHMGKSFDIVTNKGYKLHVALLANPSHLEIVNPVVEGSARARQDLKGDTARSKVLPVLIHGDAAFIGQGVVPETLNLGTLPGYTTGGTVHIVINNQVGFTANPTDAFGTEYCTDFARMLQVPIFHVNGDDAEACANVMKLAMDYRAAFKRDVVIDLVCYRRYGHNEGDDPTFTQPQMYAKIAKHPTTFAKYREELTASQVMTAAEVDTMEKAFAATLDEAYTTATSKGYKTPPDMFGGVWEGLSRRPTDEPATGVSTKALEAVSKATLAFPKGFTPHPKVLKTLEKRAETLLKGDMDWGTAEMAAYGTLLQEGFNIRLSGQDAKRGTFSHRHAVLTDSVNGAEANPVASVAAKGARFEVINSSLSEEAVMGFEFGYSLTDPKTLTIWEAQFGDFANGAQVVIDQFLASSEVKWHRLSGLVLLLPHGYEGQGPEHSSARLERFLQLCAEDNLMVVNATTPAQIFHLLRRQVHMDARRPLVIMSPKSLLRHPEAVSATGDLVAGKFQPVILDAAVKPADVTRVVFCTGKLYYDLAAKRKESPDGAKVALVRLEQLYPLPLDGIRKALKTYAKATELVWAQEEPRNMGAWTFLLDHLAPELPKPLIYAGRDRAASPACGSAKRHATEQAAVLAAALDLKTGGK